MNRFAIYKNTFTKFLNWIYVIVAILFLLDAAHLVEIKSQAVKSLVYYGFIVATPVVVIWNLFAIANLRYKIASLILPVVAIAFIIIVSPSKILFSSGAWQTQTVLFEDGHSGFKTIECQMQDIGALGYNKRTVEVIYLTKFFMIAHPVLNDINPGSEWIKVDKDINELGLKY